MHPAATVAVMIDDAASYGPPPVPPPAGVLGLGGRALGRAATAGLVAEIGILAVLAALALGTQRLLGRCVGDSCMGDPSTYVTILSSPFVAFAALVVAFLRFGLPRAWAVAAVVPRPYAYGVPGVELYSLNLNGFTHVLELGYSVVDRFVDVHESGPLPADVRTAACSPTLQLGEPEGLCHRLPAPDGVGIWRQQDPGDPQLAGVAASYVVVARPDVTLVVFSTAISDDASALAVVADLRPTDARTPLDTATSVSVQ